MSSKPSNSRESPALPKQKRSRNGCNECRRLHRKCDEERPACRFCRDAGKHCRYDRQLSWGGRPFVKSLGKIAANIVKHTSDPSSGLKRKLDAPLSSRKKTYREYTASQQPEFVLGPAPAPSPYQRQTADSRIQNPYLPVLQPTPDQILEKLADLDWLPDRSKELVVHFIERMGPALSMTKEMHDEMCTLILPMALSSGPQSIVLAAVLCLAGTHRTMLGIDADEKEHMEWREKCFQEAQRVVPQPNGSAGDPVIAAALLICYSDILEGGEKPMSWRWHLGAALRLNQEGDAQGEKSSLARRHLNLRCQSLNLITSLCPWNRDLKSLSGSDPATFSNSTTLTAISQLHGFAAHLDSDIDEMHLILTEKAALKMLEVQLLATTSPLTDLRQCLELRCQRLLTRIKHHLEISKTAELRFQTSRGRDWVAGPGIPAALANEWSHVNEAYHQSCIVFVLCELQARDRTSEEVRQTTRRGLWCIRQVEIRNEPCPAAALVQPLFTIGCELVDLEDRTFVVATLNKLKHLYGKANAKNAVEFLELLWTRRDPDSGREGGCLGVTDLMNEKGWDLSLK